MANFQVADGLATAIYNKNKKTICNLIYPVGAIYESTSNTNPSTYFGGTWKQIFNGPEYRSEASQVIVPEYILGDNSSKIVAGAYGDGLFAGVANLLPSNDTNLGYLNVKYKLSCEVSTSGSNKASIYLNGTKLISDITTWSGDDFRSFQLSKEFSLKDIPERRLSNYNGNGYEIKVVTNGPGSARFYGLAIHGYLKANINKYIWRRTA